MKKQCTVCNCHFDSKLSYKKTCSEKCFLKFRESKTILFNEANKRFIEQGRTDIKLCEDGYQSWKRKSKFYDLIVNDYFFAIPFNVYKRKSVHPKRIISKRESTNLIKYGTNYAHQTSVVKNKISATLKNKTELCNIENIKSKRFIIETGEHLKDWADKQPEPKPAYITLTQYFQNNFISLKDLESYFENYKNSKSSLEILAENIFQIKHFNKYVNNLNYRPDFKLSDTVYLNTDGLYWHSEEQKDKNYHFNLRKEFEDNNLRIFQIYSNELRDKPEIVKSIVDNSIGKINNKIYARKCEIKIVDQETAKQFLFKNHLMGPTNAKHVGLYIDNNLVSLMSFKEIKNICKIERFCSLLNYNVIGGFSKLLKHIESNLLKPFITEIHNWVDLRYGTGTHLESKGFIYIKDTLGFKWTDGHKTFNRLKCTTNEKKKKLSWYKIYDAGQRLYVKYLHCKKV